MRECRFDNRGASTLIQYRVRLHDLGRHYFQVECRIDHPNASQQFSLPSWIPGSYLLREYARHVVAIEAVSGGRSLAVDKVDHATWRCTDCDEDLLVTVLVYSLDESVRGAYLDQRRGFFNGTCLLLLPEGRETDAVALEIEAPWHEACADWRVATAMTPAAVDDRGFGRYVAKDYDELVDHPVEISRFEACSFDAAGVPHRFVLAGRCRTDLERLAADLRQLCQTQIEFFGRPAPFDAYLFLGLAVGEGYGGLEHRASSSLIFRRDDLPKLGELGIPANYQRILALASHEYFHSWHVKRTKPAAFMPYRLDRRNHTRLLWVFEGITSYYQERMLLISGLLGVGAHLQRLGEQLTRVYRTPGRFKQSLADSSFDAWDGLYKPEPNHINTRISYYSKGGLTALALDLLLRLRSVTLDDVVRELWRRHGAVGVGVPEGGFEALVTELAGDGLEDFFEQAVRGTDDWPLAALCEQFGVKLLFRAARGAEDLGGRPADDDAPMLTLGVSYRPCPLGLQLTAVLDGGPAEQAGLNPDDVLIAIGGLQLSARNVTQRLARYEAGEQAKLTVFRGDELIESVVRLELAPRDTVYLELDPKAEGAALARRRAWLGE